MKKILKFLGLVLIITIILLGIIFLRNYLILKKISDLQNSFEVDYNNLHVKVVTDILDEYLGDTTTEIYWYDNKVLENNTYIRKRDNQNIKYYYYKDYMTGEIKQSGEPVVKQDDYDPKVWIEEMSIYKIYDFKEDLKFSWFNIITVEDNCYKLKKISDIIYFDKDTGIMVKKEFPGAIITFEYEKGIVAENDIKISEE